MAKQTRRGFLKHSTMSVATAGLLTASPLLTTACSPTGPAASSADSLDITQMNTSQEPMMAYIRDFEKGEIALLFGSREIIYRDADLVQRMVKAAH